MALQIIQNIRTKPRIYLTYGSYLGTIYLNCLNCMHHFIYIYKRLLDPCMLILLLLSSLVCLSRFLFDMYLFLNVFLI